MLQQGKENDIFIAHAIPFISTFVELVLLPICAIQCGKNYLKKKKTTDLVFGLLLFAFFFLSCLTWLQWLIKRLFL